jgi:hypothetical protein
MIILKSILQNWVCGLDSSVTVLGAVTGSCGNDNGLSASINGWGFRDQLSVLLASERRLCSVELENDKSPWKRERNTEKVA